MAADRTSQRFDLLIVGAGPSGLAAALAASQALPRMRIAILEKESIPGRKLLASGNGRCNLFNRHLQSTHYHSGQPELLADLLTAAESRQDLGAFFRNLGILFYEEADGRIYPLSQEAASVQALLLDAVQKAGVKLFLDSEVGPPRQLPGGRWGLQTADGRRFSANQLIFAGGSPAAPELGGSGSNQDWTKALKLPAQTERPALCPLILADSQLCERAAGCRCSGQLKSGQGATEKSRRGEFLFQPYGLSGIAAMEVSADLLAATEGVLQRGEVLLPGKGSARRHRYPEEAWYFLEAPLVWMDFLPELTVTEVRDYLSRRGISSLSLRGLFRGKLAEALLAAFAAVNKRGNRRANEASNISEKMAENKAGESISEAGLAGRREQQRSFVPAAEELAARLKNWPLRVRGLLSFAHAQAAWGGLVLSALDEHFELRAYPGLYWVGEALDVLGDCGGFNLSWAWLSGITAGRAAARGFCPCEKN